MTTGGRRASYYGKDAHEVWEWCTIPSVHRSGTKSKVDIHPPYNFITKQQIQKKKENYQT